MITTSQKAGLVTFLAFVIGLPLLTIYVAVVGLHFDTGHGSQTGFVSATEVEGLVFKTNRAYIKPTLESTQEDAYCVTDPAVYTQLQRAEIEKRTVTVKHNSLLIPGVMTCKGEAAIINTVL